MTDFSTRKQIEEKLKSYKPKSVGPIGEAVVALQFLNVFKEEIYNIDNSGNDVDLTIKFKNEEELLTVEVKSSTFKDDYFRNHWVYGVPIKAKDLNYDFDLLAMVNFIPPDETNHLGKNSKIRSDYKNITLYFIYNELETLPPNPFMYIPTTTLLKLKNECDDIKNFNNFFNNYYKGIMVDPTIIFDEVSFSWDNYKLKNNLKGEIGLPSWFNKSLSCKYLANYAENERVFYVNEVKNKLSERINLTRMKENAFTKKNKKSRIKEDYLINLSFCKDCSQKCEYIPNKR